MDYDYSNNEVDDLCAAQYDAGQRCELENLLQLLNRRKEQWLAIQPGNAMTFARAAECKEIIDEIMNNPIQPEGIG